MNSNILNTNNTINLSLQNIDNNTFYRLSVIENPLPSAIEIEEEHPQIAIPINKNMSPEILAYILNNNQNECYKYCIVIPLGIIGVLLIVYYTTVN